jgi:hypothetical protein
MSATPSSPQTTISLTCMVTIVPTIFVSILCIACMSKIRSLRSSSTIGTSVVDKRQVLSVMSILQEDGAQIVRICFFWQLATLSTKLAPPEILRHVSQFSYQRITGACKSKTVHGLVRVSQFVCSAEISFAFSKNLCVRKQLRPCDEFANKYEEVHIPSCQVIETDQSDNTLVANGVDPCIVCMEHPPDAVLLECGHSGLCVECATVLWDQARRCPLCRRGFAAVMRIVARDSEAHTVSVFLITRFNIFPLAPSAPGDCARALT